MESGSCTAGRRAEPHGSYWYEPTSASTMPRASLGGTSLSVLSHAGSHSAQTATRHRIRSIDPKLGQYVVRGESRCVGIAPVDAGRVQHNVVGLTCLCPLRIEDGHSTLRMVRVLVDTAKGFSSQRQRGWKACAGDVYGRHQVWPSARGAVERANRAGAQHMPACHISIKQPSTRDGPVLSN